MLGLQIDKNDVSESTGTLIGLSRKGRKMFWKFGFKNSEEDDGSVIASIDGVIAVKNGGKGIVLEEEGVGDVRAFIESTITNTNDDSDKTGLEAVQEDVGSGIIKIVNSQLFDGIDAEGVQLK